MTIFLNLKHVLYTFLILISVSCGMYVPNTQNVPLFTEKNQTKLLMSPSFGVASLGLDFQMATSVSNHIGLMANGYLGVTGSYASNYFGDLGIGYYTIVSETSDSKYVFEIYAAYGGGASEFSESLNSLNFSGKANYNRTFVQPAIGLITGNIELAFSNRIAMINLKNPTDFEFDLYTPEVLIEPAFTFRAGKRNTMFELQVLYSIHTRDDLFYFDAYDPLHLSLGIYLSL